MKEYVPPVSGIIEATTKRLAFLEKVVKEIERQLERAPEGWLDISRRKNPAQVQYAKATYHHEDGKKHVAKTYLDRSQEKIIVRLAQKGYFKTILPLAKREIEVLQLILKIYPTRFIEDVFDTYSPDRKALVNPIPETDENYIKRWLASVERGQVFHPEELIHETNNGELVRSKSEAMIANYLLETGRPYVYEPLLKFQEGNRTRWVRPDFIVLDPPTRTVFLIEHLGRLDDKEYLELSGLDKIKRYEENGFFSGKNIIYTLETKDRPFVISQLKRKIDTLLS